MPNQKYQDFFQIAENYIHPYLPVNTEEILTEDGKKVLLIHVLASEEYLYERKDNHKVFLRVGDETKEQNHYSIQALKYDKNLRSFEAEVCHEFDPKDFRGSLIEHYRDVLQFKGSFEELLLARHLAKKKDEKVLYTNAAVLLFAESPEKYISNCHIRYVRYKGDVAHSGSNFNVIKDERFE